MSYRLIATLGLALALSGCLSAGERRALEEERCRSYGFRQASEAFSQCLLELDLDRSASRRAQLNDFGGWGGPHVGFGYGFRR
jgi:hypothetical protein